MTFITFLLLICINPVFYNEHGGSFTIRIKKVSPSSSLFFLVFLSGPSQGAKIPPSLSSPRGEVGR